VNILGDRVLKRLAAGAALQALLEMRPNDLLMVFRGFPINVKEQLVIGKMRV
jgi:hypothetical protein